MKEAKRLAAAWRQALARYELTNSESDSQAEELAYDKLITWIEAHDLLRSAKELYEIR